MFADVCKNEMKNAITPQGFTVILYAAVYKNFEAVNYLSIRGYNSNVEDKEGKTLLIQVLLQEQFDLAGKLVARGASIDYQNKDG